MGTNLGLHRGIMHTVRPVHGIETPFDLHRACAGVLGINWSSRARFPTKGGRADASKTFLCSALGNALRLSTRPSFCDDDNSNRTCSPMRALDIEHCYHTTRRNPRLSCPTTNYLLFCRGILRKSVDPPKDYSLEIPCSRDWTRPVYGAVLVARYSVRLSVRVNGYDLIRSCFCFGTVSCERNCSKYQLIDEEAYVSASTS